MTSKTKVKVCRICLRPDVRTRDVDPSLSDFYDELCEYDTFENQSLKYCAICEHQLRKCYHFKQRCQRGNAVLKAWRAKKLLTFPKSLHRLLPPSPLAFCSPSARHHEADYRYADHGPAGAPGAQGAGGRVWSDSEESQDPQEDVPLSSLSLAQVKTAAADDLKVTAVDLKDIVGGLKQENDNDDDFVSAGSAGAESTDDTDDDAMDSDLEAFMDRCIKTEAKKPKTRHKQKTDKRTLKTKKVVDEVIPTTDVQDDKTPQNNTKYLSIKQKVEEMLDRGEIRDLGDSGCITREVFLKIYDKCLLSDLRMLSLKKDSQGQYTKLKKALQHLLKKYNPDYETVFDIEYLDTEDKKLAEFNRRKTSKSYTDATFKCELCFRGFEKQTQFEYHNKWHTESAGEFSCGICGMRFQSLKTRASHRASSHSAVYACRMCPLVTYHYPVMLNHYEQHKGVEYSCPICLSVFENKTTFMNHQRDHNADKKKSVCASCACTFISDVGLMLHRKSKHADSAPPAGGPHSTCAECNVVFDTQEVYMKHVAMSHTKKVESHRCAYCHIRFPSLEELRAHKLAQGHQRASGKYAQRGARANRPNPVTKVRVNTPGRPFVQCELCPAMVSTAFTSCMYKHFLKEHPDIPYSSVYSQTARRLLCHLCGKTFMDPAFFADHANVHSGERPYACALCPARFHTRRHLGLHSPRHQPAAHACDLCHKRFHSAANLYNHRKTHIGDRRFKCEICLKGFLHAATLNEHVRGVHHHIRKQKNRKETY